MSLIPKVGRSKWRLRAILIVITAFLWLGVIIHFVPIWWGFTASIKPNSEIYRFPPPLWPKTITFSSYRIIMSGMARRGGVFIGGSISAALPTDQPLWVFLKNSAIMTGAITILQVFIGALVGYSLSKLCSPRWSGVMFLFFIGIMLVPSGASLIPRFLLLRVFPFATKTAPYIPFTRTRFPSVNFLNNC